MIFTVAKNIYAKQKINKFCFHKKQICKILI